MLDKSLELTWLESNGGPLMLLARDYLPNWGGNSPPVSRPDSRVRSHFGETSLTDYERAARITDYLGILCVGKGKGLILGSEPLPTAWVPNSVSNDSGLIVRWISADDEKHILDALLQIPGDIWEPSSLDFPIGPEPLILFDAAFRGDQLTAENHLTLRLPPGSYRILSTEFQPDENTDLILHRFVRLTS